MTNELALSVRGLLIALSEVDTKDSDDWWRYAHFMRLHADTVARLDAHCRSLVGDSYLTPVHDFPIEGAS